MADIILLCLVVIAPSVLALLAIESLAGRFPSFRSNDHMMTAVGSCRESVDSCLATSVKGTVNRGDNGRARPSAHTPTRRAGAGSREHVGTTEAPVVGSLRAKGARTSA